MKLTKGLVNSGLGGRTFALQPSKTTEPLISGISKTSKISACPGWGGVKPQQQAIVIKYINKKIKPPPALTGLIPGLDLYISGHAQAHGSWRKERPYQHKMGGMGVGEDSKESLQDLPRGTDRRPLLGMTDVTPLPKQRRCPGGWRAFPS